MTEIKLDFATELDLDKRFGWFSKFNNVVVAVSGGSDSLALLHLVCRWQRTSSSARSVRLPRIIAVTVDHGLRPEAADEARQVATWSCELGVEHRKLIWHGEKPPSAIQDIARRARYRLIGTLIKDLPGRSLVLTGHTRDDQAETVLMRLARGSGPEGLAGIAARTEVYGYDLHRPLLDLTREDLRAFLRYTNVNWLDDPSNESAAFERIRVRKNSQARLALGLNNAALARTAWRMARAHSALDDAANRFVWQMVQYDDIFRRYGVVTWDGKCWELSDEIAIRVLRRIIFCTGGQTNFPGLGQTENFFQKISGEDFTGTTLAGCRSMAMRKGDDEGTVLLFFREYGRFALPRVILSAPGEIVWDHRFRIRLAEVAGGEMEIAPLGQNISALRKMDVSVSSIPTGIPVAALETLPSLHANGRLVAVPSLGLHQAGYNVSAEFMVQRLLHNDQTKP